MNYIVRNKITKTVMTKPVRSSLAHEICSKLNRTSSNQKYELAPVNESAEKLSTVMRPMTEDEIYAIKNLTGINYSPGAGHSDLVNSLLLKIQMNDFQISEKQAAYLWFIVFHYRKQISDAFLISKAEKNKVY
jgi:hypothetical protein